MPPLLLQPLVENAVTHGIATLVEGGTVAVRTSRNGSRLAIVGRESVRSGQEARRGTGVGLENVKRRLDAAYGREALADGSRSGRHVPRGDDRCRAVGGDGR